MIVQRKTLNNGYHMEIRFGKMQTLYLIYAGRVLMPRKCYNQQDALDYARELGALPKVQDEAGQN